MKVYFIPGLGASSNCFKFITLPEGFEKVYIEWFTPEGNETLEEYTRKLAESIDTSEPFILVGYSFGGVIVQEMNKFLNPQKTILIASMKNDQQIPNLFKIIKALRFAYWFPMRFFSSQGLLSYAFARSVYYKSKNQKIKETLKIEEYLSQTNPKYLKWSINAISSWKSTIQCKNIFQIHGTKDPIFPYKKIRKSYEKNRQHLFTIPEANHILVLEKPKKVNEAFKNILLNN
ncbi:alpha/beta hydrolase [Apibacter raozihei]|uniref:alpha/beta fold hydrolase n=1 Tax=Apibacter TaxID=1778601 RepID=UPI000FE2A215|nr:MULTISPECIES: alpha/beta hydrolase [Apibacter]